MSHVVSIDFAIRNLDALAVAAEALGLELVRGQATYRWWGHHVGDFPLPAGFAEADLGKCEHALRVKGDPRAYEVGVVRRRDGQAGWTLVFDFYGTHGRALERAVGVGCKRLKQEYSAAVAIGQARKMGLRSARKVEADGTIRIVLSQ